MVLYYERNNSNADDALHQETLAEQQLDHVS